MLDANFNSAGIVFWMGKEGRERGGKEEGKHENDRERIAEQSKTEQMSGEKLCQL